MGLGKRKTRVAFWRKVRGFSQEEVGRVLRVTGRTISNWECDQTEPTRAQAEILAELLRVNIRELFPYTLF